MRDDTARAMKAKNAMLIEAADASVKIFVTVSRIWFVIGMAAEDAEISRYAITCEVGQAISNIKQHQVIVKVHDNHDSTRQIRALAIDKYTWCDKFDLVYFQ